MYLLTMHQEDWQINLGAFETMEEARKFLAKIPGYQCEEEDGFL